MNSLITVLNKSPFFQGLSVVTVLLGGKYVLKDINDDLEEILKTDWFKRLVVFCSAFVGTQNIKTSFLILMVYIFIFEYLLNNGSSMCILKNKKQTQQTNVQQLSVIPRAKIQVATVKQQYPSHDSLSLLTPRPSYDF